MKKTFLPAISVAALLLLTVSLHAQSGTLDGCSSSPENPTVVLALVGSAGAAVASIRMRMKARRNGK